MADMITHGGLGIARILYDFVNDEALAGTGLSAEAFWSAADRIIHRFAPDNRALIARRDELQAENRRLAPRPWRWRHRYRGL